ncbi:hypothetical protein NONO_c09990 [Nocardia nova SH22a]|uniref:Uncharacterized protein n=1 Tax=Nocardia nova SH22a TaxID=1415166 RepID=W5TEX8_9NOCA|nr:hypothetical protein [Nocardia nova]AHH15806.1 hypothetical protein NONO_c09990 [Nocardia nova SH22a]
MDLARYIEDIVQDHATWTRNARADYEDAISRLDDGGGAELAEAIQRADDEAERQARIEAEERAREEQEAREQREAIARSAAARKANESYVPADAEDEDDAYYRRKSWLV